MAKHFVGARIRSLRLRHGLTQVEMAKRLNISTSYLNQLENDQRPLSVTVLMSLTQAFDVEAAFFSSDRDARTIAELHDAFPSVPQEQLSDLASRCPEFVGEILSSSEPATDSALGPYEVVRDFFYDQRNYFHELDVAGEELAERIGLPQLRLGRLSSTFDKDLSITVRFRGPAEGPRRVYQPATRTLTLRTGLSEAQMCFELSLQYCLLTQEELLDGLVDKLPDEQSRGVARLGLAQYFAAAVAMPYAAFLGVAEEVRYDIDRISSHFGTSFESTCHRLSTLQRPGARGVPFFFVRTDRAGNISKRQSATSFHFSRTGGSCPLWVVHRAFETPGRVTRQVATMPDGRSYLWIARYVAGPSAGFGRPRKEFAVGLGCDLQEAERLVYSDGLDLSPDSATPIGPGCTSCTRENCPQRAFPLAGRKISLDVNASREDGYATTTPSRREPRGGGPPR